MPIRKSLHTIYNIFNEMNDLVRVIDLNDNVVYNNKSFISELGYDYVGTKCYKALDNNIPCDNCLSRKTRDDHKSYEKQISIHGKHFSVESSALLDDDGNMIGTIEVFRDITKVVLLNQDIQKRNEEIKYQTSIAKRVQERFLPRHHSSDDYDFSYLYIPYGNLSGDMFDIYHIDETHIGLYIADVSGKGIPAALITMFLSQNIDKTTTSPKKALDSLYKKFNNLFPDENVYISIFYSVIHLDSNSLKFTNAGMNCMPVIARKHSIEKLQATGYPISNWVDDVSYFEHTVPFEKGEKLILYTDGLIENKNFINQRYSDERLFNIIEKNKISTMAIIKNKIIQDLQIFLNEKDLQSFKDDVTLVLFERK